MLASCQQNSFRASPRCCIPTKQLTPIMNFGSRHCLYCRRAPRKAHQALADGDAQVTTADNKTDLDQGRVILIDNQVASADLSATPRTSDPIITPAAPRVKRRQRPL